jgi:hypothetical protein
VIHLNPADVDRYLNDVAYRNVHLNLLTAVQTQRGAPLPVVVEYNPFVKYPFLWTY